MKTYYKLITCLLILGFSMMNITKVNSQCTSAFAFGSGSAPTGTGVVTLTTCAFSNEYSTISSVVAGSRYTITAIGSTNPNVYITVRFSTPTGVVVAAGVTPLQFTAPCSGTYYSHYHFDNLCSTTSSGCITATISCASCGAASNQCTNTSSFGSAVAPSAGTVTISTCSFQSEFSTISSVAANTVYRFTAGLAGTFISVRSGSSAGPIVASGRTPLIFTSTVAGTYFPHWNTNITCGTAGSCMTTTIGFVGGPPCGGPPPTGCTNTAAFGSGTIPPNNTIVTLTTCAFAGEYSTIFGAVAGQTLQFTGTSSYSPVYLTVHSGTFNGPIIGAGNSPLTISNTFTGTLFLHYNTNAACGTLSACHTGTVQCTSCGPAGPPNDLCTGATTIACGGTISSTTVGATTQFILHTTVPPAVPSGSR